MRRPRFPNLRVYLDWFLFSCGLENAYIDPYEDETMYAMRNRYYRARKELYTALYPGEDILHGSRRNKRYLAPVERCQCQGCEYRRFRCGARQDFIYRLWVRVNDIYDDKYGNDRIDMPDSPDLWEAWPEAEEV